MQWIEGPKACGKTVTATQHAETVFRFDEDDMARSLVRLSPERLFDHPTPILFDEWQVEPGIWNRVRRQVGDRDGKGLFILTGSATPRDDASRHSGAGPLLGDDDAPHEPLRVRPFDWRDVADRAAQRRTAVWCGDALELRRDPQAHRDRRLARTRARLRTAPVRYFVNPSLATAALGVGSADLITDLKALGLYYENLVVRDLRIYAQLLNARVDSWRDSHGNEVDVVVVVGPRKWAAFEIRLNPDAVDQAAAALIRFGANVDTSVHGEPSCLGVITSTGVGGLREDGVHVIPIGCLGP